METRERLKMIQELLEKQHKEQNEKMRELEEKLLQMFPQNERNDKSQNCGTQTEKAENPEVLRKRLLKLQTEKEGIQTELVQRQAQIAVLNGKNMLLEECVAGLMAQLDEMREAFEKKVRENDSLRVRLDNPEEIASLQRKVAEYEKRLQKSKDQLTEREQENTKLAEQLAQRTRENAALEKKLLKAEEEKASLLQKQKEASSLTKLKKENSELKKQLADIKAEKDDWSSIMAEMDREIKSVLDSIDEDYLRSI